MTKKKRRGTQQLTGYHGMNGIAKKGNSSHRQLRRYHVPHLEWRVHYSRNRGFADWFNQVRIEIIDIIHDKGIQLFLGRIRCPI